MHRGALLLDLAVQLAGDLSGAPGGLLLGYRSAFALSSAVQPRAGLPVWLAPLLALTDLVRDPAHWRKTEHGAAVRDLAA